LILTKALLIKGLFSVVMLFVGGRHLRWSKICDYGTKDWWTYKSAAYFFVIMALWIWYPSITAWWVSLSC